MKTKRNTPGGPSDEWATPQDVFIAACDWFDTFPILDLAADKENTKCELWYAKDRPYEPTRNLIQSYDCWCNPPYSNPGPFVEQCNEAQSAIALLKCDPSTKVFAFCAREAQEIALLNWRIKFVGAPNVAPFASMLVYFNSSMPKRGARIYSLSKEEFFK